MQIPDLRDFCLVGGTALSLKYGHRLSIDIDLFGVADEFKKEEIIQALKKEFGAAFVYDGSNSKWAIFCFIEDIKVDIVRYTHSLIKPKQYVDSFRLLSSEDICAMKINAILGRGKKKDFWDLFELMHHFSLSVIIGFHREKFPKIKCF